MWEIDEYVNMKIVTCWSADAQLRYKNTYYMNDTYYMNHIWLTHEAGCISELEWNTKMHFVCLISTFLQYKGSWILVQYFPLVKMQLLKMVIRARIYKMKQNTKRSKGFQFQRQNDVKICTEISETENAFVFVLFCFIK